MWEMIMKIKTLQQSSLLLSALMLGACGGSSSSNNTTDVDTDITGVAATGAAIVGTVYAIDANGEQTDDVTIAENGDFSIDVDGLSAPFLVCAESSDMTIQLCSYSEGGEDVNVNPLTNLALYLAAEVDAIEDLIEDWSNYSSAFNRDDIDEQIPLVNVNFEDAYENQGIGDYNYDFFTEDMEVGDDGLDQVLDHIDSISINEDTGVITIIMQNPDTFEDEAGSETFDEDRHVPVYNVSITGGYYDSQTQDEAAITPIVITENVSRPLESQDGQDVIELLQEYFDVATYRFGDSLESTTFSVTIITSDESEYYLTVVYTDVSEDEEDNEDDENKEVSSCEVC